MRYNKKMQNTVHFWDKKHNKYATTDWIAKPTIFVTQVIKYFPKGGKVLKLGCGQGADAIYFAQNGYKVVASDFSPNAIEHAKKQIPEELRDQREFMVLSVLLAKNKLNYSMAVLQIF